MSRNIDYSANQVISPKTKIAMIYIVEPLGFNPMSDMIDYNIDLNALINRQILSKVTMLEFANSADRPLAVVDRYSGYSFYVPAKTYIRNYWLGNNSINIKGNGTYGGGLSFAVIEGDVPFYAYTTP